MSLRILVFGAGALGTLYAAHLAESGHDVTLLARGRRLEETRESGLVLRPRGETAFRVVRVETTDQPRAGFDLVLVCVRFHHMAAALPALERTAPADVLTLVQNAGGLAPWRAALGDRLIAGFAGAAATFTEGGLEYTVAPRALQPTTIATSDRSPRIREALEGAGFPVVICDDMDAWLRWHAAWIIVNACGVQRVGGDPRALARRGHIQQMVDALAEGGRALRATGIPVRPAGLRWLFRTPPVVLRAALAALVRLPAFRQQIIPNALTAPKEAQAIGAQLVELGRRQNLPMPAWRYLLGTP